MFSSSGLTCVDTATDTDADIDVVDVDASRCCRLSMATWLRFLRWSSFVATLTRQLFSRGVVLALRLVPIVGCVTSALLSTNASITTVPVGYAWPLSSTALSAYGRMLSVCRLQLGGTIVVSTP